MPLRSIFYSKKAQFISTGFVSFKNYKTLETLLELLDVSLISIPYTKVRKINQKEKIMKTVLEIHGLTKQFANQAILQDLSLTIKEGDIYGLIGKTEQVKLLLSK